MRSRNEAQNGHTTVVVATGSQRLNGQPARDVPKEPVVIENARRADNP